MKRVLAKVSDWCTRSSKRCTERKINDDECSWKETILGHKFPSNLMIKISHFQRTLSHCFVIIYLFIFSVIDISFSRFKRFTWYPITIGKIPWPSSSTCSKQNPLNVIFDKWYVSKRGAHQSILDNFFNLFEYSEIFFKCMCVHQLPNNLTIQSNKQKQNLN